MKKKYINKFFIILSGYIPLLTVIFILGSLLSYNSSDPSFNHSTNFSSSNLFSVFGSYFADFSYQFLGLYPFFICLVISVWFLKSKILKITIPYLKFRKLLLIPSVFIVTSICSLLPATESWPFYVDMGGVIGSLSLSITKEVLYNYKVNNIYVYSFLILLSFPFLLFVIGITLQEYKIFTNFILWLFYKFYLFLYVIKTFLCNITNYILGKKYKSINGVIENAIQKKKHINSKRKDSEIKIAKRKDLKKGIIDPGKEKSMNLPFKEYFILPELSLLNKAKVTKNIELNKICLEQNAKLLKNVLENFGITGKIAKAYPGPVITLYEFEPSAGTKSSRVIGLSDDIARSMSSTSARISVVPGRNVLGIELPNATRETVYLSELLNSEDYNDSRIKLPIALGKDIAGVPFIVDLSRMPHLLIAGTTGSGKSVSVNAMILSLLYRLKPEDCKFIMIDPKMLELSIYNGIPHLLSPVVTDPKKAAVALNWVVKEMEERYRVMSKLGTRNISNYNEKAESIMKSGEKTEHTVQTGFNPETGEPVYETQEMDIKKLPFIIVILDEMADLMLTVRKEIETSVQRIAQMARAAGIHVIMATQRPSVDVITGVIKANFPTRISFQVTSRIDSRTILGEMGAEQLLGMGDMLYMGTGGRLTRIHSSFVSDEEVERIVNHLKKQPGSASVYTEDILEDDDNLTSGGNLTFDNNSNNNDDDKLYNKAVSIILNDKKVSISYVQRQLKIGYNRAANIIERMEKEGIISVPNHSGKRDILV